MCFFYFYKKGDLRFSILFYYLLQNESFDHRSFINFMSDGSMLLSSFFMLCLLEIRDIYYTCMQFLWCCYYCCLFLDKEADTSKVHKFKNLSHSNYTELYPLFFGCCCVFFHCYCYCYCFSSLLTSIFASI